MSQQPYADDADWANAGDEPTMPSVVATANAIASSYGVTPDNVYDAVGVFDMTCDEATARTMSHDGRVVCVAQDSEGGASTVQSVGDNWGLDRIDQAVGTDGSFHYNGTGAGVHAYVVDSGIAYDQPEFGGRVFLDYSAVPGENPDGLHYYHGTAVASVLGGRTYGVAKGVWLHSVKALDGKDHTNASRLVRAFNWIRKHHQSPAVMNCSLYVKKLPKWIDWAVHYTAPVERAYKRLIGSGVVCVTCAGNFADSANNYVPSGVGRGITVSATSRDDTQAYDLVNGSKKVWANYGDDVDIWAPGDRVGLLRFKGDGSSRMFINGTDSGTSYSSPYVAGVVAQYLRNNPSALPSDVKTWLNATADATHTSVTVLKGASSTTKRFLLANQ